MLVGNWAVFSFWLLVFSGLVLLGYFNFKELGISLICLSYKLGLLPFCIAQKGSAKKASAELDY